MKLHETLMLTISCAHSAVQPLLNSKRGRRKCGNAVLLMVDDESVFLGQKKLRDQERKKSHSLVPNRNRDKMALPDWEFPDV